MAILIVTYDLKAPKDYKDFYNALKMQGPWWHYLASTWLIETNRNAQQVFEALHPHMEQQDSILVAEMAPSYPFGWLPKDAWDWVNSRVQRQQQSSFQFTPSNPLQPLNPPFHKTE
jgi:hypothetical protein